MKNLLFITTSSLAANPRLVKEFETLKTNYRCYVVHFIHHDWSFQLSEHIISRNQEVHFISIDRKKLYFQTFFCQLMHKLMIGLNRFLNKNILINSIANNNKALQILLIVSTLVKKYKFERVIAHNLGTFYPAVKLSEKNNCLLQLDIEDFYPGEAIYFNESNDINNRMSIMEFSFLKADAVSYASKGIKRECEKYFKIKQNSKHEIILNVFNSSDFLEPAATRTKRIQCVWFSQYIGPMRGIDVIFSAAKSLPHIDFNLIGSVKNNFIKQIDLSENIIIHPIMKQEDLHSFLGKMDIGLALEAVNVDNNRKICLTNKILTYVQSGLYVLATNTYGQSQFLNSLDYDAGMIINSSLTQELDSFNVDKLTTELKSYRWHQGKSISWDIEKNKLYNLLSFSFEKIK